MFLPGSSLVRSALAQATLTGTVETKLLHDPKYLGNYGTIVKLWTCMILASTVPLNASSAFRYVCRGGSDNKRDHPPKIHENYTGMIGSVENFSGNTCKNFPTSRGVELDP